MRTDGRGRISILNKRWEIPTAKYPVTLSVDRLPPVTFVGEAEGSMVSVWWKLTPDEINIVSNGAVLRATVGQEIYEYNLAGSRGMLRVVAECTDELMRSANPFASTAPQARTPPTNPFPETASNPYRRM